MSENSSNNKMIDHRLKVLSYEQFLIDIKSMKFNKICMTEVINADMMIAIFGENQFYQTSAEILAMGNMAYKQMGIDNIIHIYAHTYKTFIAVANDDMSYDDFLNLMKVNHEQYELITARQTGLGGVSRFVLAFGDDLIDRCKSALYKNRNLPNNFIIAGNEKEELAEENNQNQNIFELLNYALKNDKVIPFYQGIYNNETCEIKKYEALIRIYDSDDKIHYPGSFLDASKQIKLYLSLSKTVIDKALKDFEGKESTVSLNISLIDIQSEEFKNWILKRLKQHKTPEKVVIEFIETENYNNNDELFEFLAEVRKIGCQIAVDDFGVGFATYSSIISLKPDIVKIDGDIIRTIAQNEDNVTILKSIKYMADLIGAKTTAEFVENKEIHDVLIQHSINFSQGYYFAKPEPFEKLNVK